MSMRYLTLQRILPLQLTQILIAFDLLGLFPLLVRIAMKYLKQTNTVTTGIVSGEEIP